MVKAEQLFLSDPRMVIEAFATHGIDGNLIQRMVVLESGFIPDAMEGINIKSCVVGGNVKEDFGKEWS